MQIRKVKIENYRGIKNLELDIPKGQKFIGLIGPGDSRKSTILDAISLATTDRWNVAVSDTDFYNCDSTVPIRITLVISSLTSRIMRDDILGMFLGGIDGDGAIFHDPEDGCDPCIIVRVTVDHELEPQWTIERFDDQDASRPLSSSVRRALGVFKVDERLDVHLRWTRVSSLTKLSSNDGSTTPMIAEATRAARQAIASLSSPGLDDVSQRVKAKFHAVGGGQFSDLRPGLDTSGTVTGGNLALYDGNVPLTNFGLGTRRLAGLAVQSLASKDKAILLIDEIEYGLEPHRLVNFMRQLKNDKELEQVFVTTHSPIAVEQLSTTDLAVVRANGGEVSASLLDKKSSTTTRLQRSRPSSWLARRIVVVEGKTEEGLLLQLFDHWDSERIEAGESSTAGLGVIIQDGQGGSEAPPRALELARRGYEVALFLDNDVRSVDKAVTKAEKAGVSVFRWGLSLNTEQQMCAELSVDQLSSFLELAVRVRNNEKTVMNDLYGAGLSADIDSLKVSDWISSHGMTLENSRIIVADAAVKSIWFKGVDQGRELGSWLIGDLLESRDLNVVATILSLKNFVFNEDVVSDDDQ